MQAEIDIVWFKRDLRVEDHAALAAAAAAGRPVLPLYVIEPALWAQPDYSGRHATFLHGCLRELRETLAALGAPLVIRIGAMPEVLEAIGRQYRVRALFSHQETGNDWTFRRDRAVARWCRDRGVIWHEFAQQGVFRGTPDRDRWAQRRESFVAQPVVAPPKALCRTPVDPGPLPTLADWLDMVARPDAGRVLQAGGRRFGQRLLEGFLDARCAGYRRKMSAPGPAVNGCSRLSPYLAWGALSIREVVQATRGRLVELPEGSAARAGLVAFESRLAWHCHFIQKLETEPRIEFANLHPAMDGLREPDFDPVRFEAWARGETGWPMVDACMRSLAATGWLNFRMRAMLVSVAAYGLWLHWRAPALHLARLFTDYEPGIHYCQMQMQSGTTGINALRVYDPVGQSRKLDPEGRFIRQWLPELGGVPKAWIHEPWRMPANLQARFGTRLDHDYPVPLLDLPAASRAARARVADRLHSEAARTESRRIHLRHGSRLKKARSAGKRAGPEDSRQLSLFP